MQRRRQAAVAAEAVVCLIEEIPSDHRPAAAESPEKSVHRGQVVLPPRGMVPVERCKAEVAAARHLFLLEDPGDRAHAAGIEHVEGSTEMLQCRLVKTE